MHRFGSDLLLWLLAGFAWCYTLTVLEDRVATHPTSTWGPSARPSSPVSSALLVLACPARCAASKGDLLVYAGALTYPFYLVHQSLGIPVTRGVLEIAYRPLVCSPRSRSASPSPSCWPPH